MGMLTSRVLPPSMVGEAFGIERHELDASLLGHLLVVNNRCV